MKVRMEMDKELALALIKNGLAINMVEELVEEPKNLCDKLAENYDLQGFCRMDLANISKRVISEAVEKAYKEHYVDIKKSVVAQAILTAIQSA